MIKKFNIMIAFIIPVIWCLPAITGFLTAQTNNEVFLGFIRSDDFHRYGSFVEQTAEENRFVYWDYSVVEPQEPRIIAVYFWTLGLLKKVTGAPTAILWLISRLVIGWSFFWCLYRLLKYSLIGDKGGNTADWVFLIIAVSTGVDHILNSCGIMIPRMKNVWMDGFSTFNSFHNPLKIAGMTAGLLLMEQMLQIDRNYKLHISIAGSLVLLLWLLHPNSAIPFYLSLCFMVFSADQGKWMLNSVVRRIFRWSILLVPIFFIFLYIRWMQTDPATANIIKQYHVPLSRESFANYPFRYGILVPLSIMGLFLRLKSVKQIDLGMAGLWIGAEFFAHLPFMTGLLFQHVVHLPMAYFAAFPLVWLNSKKPRSSYVVLLLLLAVFFTAHGLTIAQVCDQTAKDVWPTSLYVSNDEYDAIQWLETQEKGNVFVNPDTGNKIGWMARKPVFLGHWGTTQWKKEKNIQLKKFYSADKTNEYKKAILAQHNLKYLWYGKRERNLGDLPRFAELSIVYENGSVTILRFTQ